MSEEKNKDQMPTEEQVAEKEATAAETAERVAEAEAGVECGAADKDKKKKCGKKLDEECKRLREEAEKAQRERDETQDKYLRLAAEYDNFRKRSAKEKEGIYSDAYAEALKQLLPIIDNLERAAACEDGAGVAEGVKLTLAQCATSLDKLGIEAISSEVGEPFNPELHNAVMHTEDESLGESVIAAVFQKGYKRGDRVIRFAMVSVAN